MSESCIFEKLMKRRFYSLRKTVEKVSLILVTVTSRSDSDFESSNVSLRENKHDGVNPNSNDMDNYVRKNEGKNSMFFDRLSGDKYFCLSSFRGSPAMKSSIVRCRYSLNLTLPPLKHRNFTFQIITRPFFLPAMAVWLLPTEED